MSTCHPPKCLSVVHLVMIIMFKCTGRVVTLQQHWEKYEGEVKTLLSWIISEDESTSQIGRERNNGPHGDMQCKESL